MMAHLLLRKILVAGSTAALAAGLAFAQDKPAAAPVKKPAAAHPMVKEPADSEMGHVHYLDYRNGFRGVKFGSSSSAIPGLSLTREQGSMKIYQKSGESLSIGDCQLDRILYHFVDDKFMGVSLFPKDTDDGKSLQQIFEIAFGDGATSKPHADAGAHHEHADEFFWKGKIANARLSYTEAHQAEAWIGNNDLQDAYGKIQKKAAEEAAATLY
jgi:hypothetical protein